MPEGTLGLLLDISPCDAHIVQRRIAQTGQLPALGGQLRGLITANLRVLGAAEDLIVLLRNPRNHSPVSETLAEHSAEGFRL
jgi:hypothetical protein